MNIINLSKNSEFEKEIIKLYNNLSKKYLGTVAQRSAIIQYELIRISNDFNNFILMNYPYIDVEYKGKKYEIQSKQMSVNCFLDLDNLSIEVVIVFKNSTMKILEILELNNKGV